MRLEPVRSLGVGTCIPGVRTGHDDALHRVVPQSHLG